MAISQGIPMGWIDPVKTSKMIYNIPPDVVSSALDLEEKGIDFPWLSLEQENSAIEYYKNKYPDDLPEERFNRVKGYAESKRQWAPKQTWEWEVNPIKKETMDWERQWFGSFMRESLWEFTAPTRAAISHLPKIWANILDAGEDVVTWMYWPIMPQKTKERIKSEAETMQEWAQWIKEWMQEGLWVDPESFSTKSWEFVAEAAAMMWLWEIAWVNAWWFIPWMAQAQLWSVVSEWEPATIAETLIWWAINKWIQLAWEWFKAAKKIVKPYMSDIVAKGIKPTWLTTTKAMKWFEDKVVLWAESIINNLDNLSLVDDAWQQLPKWKLPETISQFSDAIWQNKQHIYKAFKSVSDDVAQQWRWWLVNSKVEIAPIVDDLNNEIINNKNLQDFYPDVVSEAKKYADIFTKRWAEDVDNAYELLKMFNSELSVFYNKASKWTLTSSDIAKNNVLLAIRNQLSKQVDDTIMNALWWDDVYRALKDQYSALTSIERQVWSRAAKEMNKNVFWLVDYTDIYTIPNAVSAITDLNVWWVIKQFSIEWIKNYMKSINSSDRYIKLLFKKLAPKELWYAWILKEAFVPESVKNIWNAWKWLASDVIQWGMRAWIAKWVSEWWEMANKALWLWEDKIQ